MCGIAGHISFEHQSDEPGVQRMMSAIAHRGPDSSGIAVSARNQATLGHRRLSILDLSDAAHQPMITRDGKLSLVYNGEIYNFRELREQFFPDSSNFHSSGDTELLLRLWQKFGPDCLLLLRGMFAFAIWDDSEECLFLARDPCGIKPLYYARVSNQGSERFVFASELKALRAYNKSWQLDPKSLGTFLKLGSIPAPATPFLGVRALEAGTLLTVTRQNQEAKKYWNYSDILLRSKRSPLSITSRDDAVAYVRQRLLESVKAHLVSDVPVGAFLSGGIDSSGVVSLMRALGQDRIGTFCIGFQSEKYDESHYAAIVAKKFETDHTCWMLKRRDFLKVQEEFFDSMDQPSVDGLNTFIVSKLAHLNNYKVVTSGIGGDEIFAGYNRDFRQLPRLYQHLRFGGKPLRYLGRAVIAGGLGLGLLSDQWQRLATYLHGELSLTRCLDMGRGLFTPKEIQSAFSDPDLGRAVADVDSDKSLPELNNSLTTRDAVSCFLAHRYLGSQLLKDSDSNSMAFSLELRTPLVDSVLYENLARLNKEAWFFEGEISKSLFVDAVGNLPREVTHRVKKGFTPPFEDWLKEVEFELESGFLSREYFNDALVKFREGNSHWSRVWTLLVLDRFLSRLSK